MRDQIAELIRAGNYAATASASVGIGESTFYRWLQVGAEEETGPYRDFLEAIKEAEATAEIQAVEAVQSQFTADWRAAMTYLERRFPERWKRRDETAHTGKDGEALSIHLKWDEAPAHVEET